MKQIIDGVSWCVSALGRTYPGVKINGRYYRDVLLHGDLLPDIRQFSDLDVSARQRTGTQSS